MKIEWNEVRDEHKAGGDGITVIRNLLTPAELNGKCRLFAQVTLEKGCSIGVHPHSGNAETYYILSGKASYTDDGEVYAVGSGETTYCADGHSHGIANAGDEPLVFMALIINS